MSDLAKKEYENITITIVMMIVMMMMMMMMRGDSINTVITYHELIAPLLPGTAQPLLATRRWT